MSNCYVWCTACGVRLTREDIKGWGCPKCGNQGVPCDPAKDVTVEINWHELHILCCWAENYAHSIKGSDKETGTNSPGVVSAIARRLENQWPDFGRLTLGAEIAELPEALAEKGIEASNVQTNVPLPKPFLSLGPGAVGFAKRRPS